MKALAKLKYGHSSAQKCRLVADQIRGMEASKALQLLMFIPKKAAGMVKKVLQSAIANAEQNEGMDVDDLKIASITVDEGSTYKRMQARAKGRSNRILKSTCHITVIVSD